MSKSNIEIIEDFLNEKNPKPDQIPCSSHGKDKLSAAYILQHVKSGKIYIGSTGDIYRRKNKHYSSLISGNHHVTSLQEAYNSNPNIRFFVILTNNREEAYDYEQQLLNHYNGIRPLFNIATNAVRSWLNLKHSEETKNKIREKVKIRMQDPNYSIMLSNANKGKIISAETKVKISKSLAGIIRSNATKEKIRSRMLGRAKSKEHAEKISQRNKLKSRPISINGVHYESIAAAGIALGIHPGTIPSKLKSNLEKYSSWFYI